jgi:hypothetical protein
MIRVPIAPPVGSVQRTPTGAERLVPYLLLVRAENPGLVESRADAPGGAHFAGRAINEAMQELYNEAQLDVLRRSRDIIRATTAEAATEPGGS